MGQQRGIITPRIVQPANSAVRVVIVLLILVALAAAILGAFSMERTRWGRDAEAAEQAYTHG